MRKLRWTALAAFIAFALAAPGAFAQQQQQQSQPPQQDSLAEAARKAKEKKAAQATKKPAKSYDNDNLPTKGKISVMGTETPAASTTGATTEGQAAAGTQGAAGAKGTGAAAEEKGEEYWRGRFKEARDKLAAAEKELDILQRELNLLSVQYYSDPQKAMKEQTERTEINEQRKKIEAKQKEVADLKAAVTALEDELRAAGGNAGWSRP